jgi:uncharacterized protein YjiS (DUF1127 family)
MSFVGSLDQADIPVNRLLQEMTMSTLTHQSMINHHQSSIFARISQTLRIWHKRQRDRRLLAQLSARDLHDVGLSWSDIVYEAEKPFWRA